MIPYGHQMIDKKDIAAITKVINSDYLTQGPEIEKFEKQLAEYCNAKYVVAVSNGTSALHLAYLVAGIKDGDEVITTPNTFVATTNMLLLLNARPVFVDIRLDTYNLDETKIEEKITKKTKAIVPVHFSGHPCEMDKILSIAKKNNLIVIEDAAHALGAKYKNKKIGSLKSDMTVFSFHPIKSITTGEGGAIVTNNKSYYNQLKLLRSHGVVKDQDGNNVMKQLGFNYRITDIQAALGVSQLKKLDRFIKKRRIIVEWYQKSLSSLNNIILTQENKQCFSSYHLMIIRTKNKSDRNKLKKYLAKKGVGVNFHYPAVYKHPYYQKIGFNKINLKNMQKYHDTTITIPLFPGLNKQQVEFISGCIKNYYNK